MLGSYRWSNLFISVSFIQHYLCSSARWEAHIWVGKSAKLHMNCARPERLTGMATATEKDEAQLTVNCVCREKTGALIQMWDWFEGRYWLLLLKRRQKGLKEKSSFLDTECTFNKRRQTFLCLLVLWIQSYKVVFRMKKWAHCMVPRSVQRQHTLPGPQFSFLQAGSHIKTRGKEHNVITQIITSNRL